MNENVCDIVGLLYHSDILDIFYQVEPQREKVALSALIKGLESKDKNEIEDLITSYGCTREETGFRIGFALALQLFLSGYNVNWL